MLSISMDFNLIPQPVKDVIMFPIAVRGNTQEAVERFTRSTLRITIAALGVFSCYEMIIHSQPYSEVRLLVVAAAVYLSSVPAGDIMYGCLMISGGSMMWWLVMNARLLPLDLPLGTNLLAAALGTGLMLGGVIIIDESAKRTARNSCMMGCLEPIFNRIAKETGIVANYLVCHRT